MDGIDLNSLGGLLNQALTHQVTQFGVAFSIAAWIHSGRVKKEIKAQMSEVVQAVNNAATALRQDLAAQDKRINVLEIGLDKITVKISTLAKQEGA